MSNHDFSESDFEISKELVLKHKILFCNDKRNQFSFNKLFLDILSSNFSKYSAVDALMYSIVAFCETEDDTELALMITFVSAFISKIDNNMGQVIQNELDSGPSPGTPEQARKQIDDFKDRYNRL